MQSMHGTLKSIEGPPNLGINLPLSIKPATQNSANHSREDAKSVSGKEKLEKKSSSPAKRATEPKKMASLGWTCWECDRLFTQRDVYLSHMRKEHGKVRVTTMLRHQEGTPVGAADPSASQSLSVVRISVTSISVCLTCFICGMNIPNPNPPHPPSPTCLPLYTQQ